MTFVTRYTRCCQLQLWLAIVTFLLGDAHARNSSGAEVLISRETTFITAPQPDGSIDYVTALNDIARDGTSVDSNAAVLLWKAYGPGPIDPPFRPRFFEELGIETLSGTGNYFIPLERFIDPEELALVDVEKARSQPWSVDEFPLLTEWLVANEKVLELVLLASERDRFFSPIVGDTELIDYRFPAANIVREFADALVLRALHSASLGKADAAWRDACAVHRLGHLIGQGHFIVQRVVSVSVNREACQLVTRLAVLRDLNSDQALRLITRLNERPEVTSMPDLIHRGERFFALDSAMSVIENGPAVLGTDFEKSTSSLTGGRADSVDWNETLREINSWYDQIVDAVRKDSRDARMMAMDAVQGQFDHATKRMKRKLVGALLLSTVVDSSAIRGRAIGLILTSLWWPPAESLQRSIDLEECWQRLATTSLALTAFYADNGTFPSQLRALSPQYLDEVPLDPFSRPLQYGWDDKTLSLAIARETMSQLKSREMATEKVIGVEWSVGRAE